MAQSVATKPEQWTRPLLGLFVVLLSMLGLLASVSLLSSELEILNDPDALLNCDLNPLVGCSSSLLTPQAHLFGIPNSSVGLIAFGALFALGAVLIFKGGLPRIVWWGFAAGMTAGLFFVVYFLTQSVIVFRSLCPYCMATWAVILALLPLAWGGALASGSFGARPRRSGASILKFSWAIVLALYLVVVIVVVITLGDKLTALF